MMAFDPETSSVPYMEGSIDSPLEPLVVEALRTVFDPEIPVSLFELGLIYDLVIDDHGHVKVIMTLTAPTCPVAEELPGMVERAIKSIDGISEVDIDLVWEPFWKPDYMTEAARLQLGLF
jgi:FeS assembly SUF system protein